MRAHSQQSVGAKRKSSRKAGRGVRFNHSLSNTEEADTGISVDDPAGRQSIPQIMEKTNDLYDSQPIAGPSDKSSQEKMVTGHCG